MTAEPKPQTLPLAEAARTLFAGNAQGLLSTLDEAGYPYGSLTDYLAGADGDPILFLSRLAEHRRYLERDPRTSLLIAPGAGSAEGLAAARLSLVGDTEPAPAGQRAALREAYLERHPQAAAYIDFADFDFFRLRVGRARFIAGFGRMGWLDGADYRAAAPDLLADIAAGAISHMNQDHGHNLRDYALAFGGLEQVDSCRMTGLDRYGFDLLCVADGRPQTLRLAFDPPLTQAARLRPALTALAERARRRLARRG